MRKPLVALVAILISGVTAAGAQAVVTEQPGTAMATFNFNDDVADIGIRR